MTPPPDTPDDKLDNPTKLNGWTDRIKERLKALGMTQEALASKVGITRSAISHYLAGRRVPSLSQFTKLAKILEANPAWLQYGADEDIPPAEKVSKLYASMHPVPILSWEEIVEFRGLKKVNPTKVKEWIPNYFTQADSLAGLRIKGDAMTSPNGHGQSFHDGDIIVVDFSIGAIAGDFVIVYLVGTTEVTFKQYVIDAGIRYLKPLNPQYPTVPVNESYNLLAVFSYCISPRTGTDRNLALVYDPSTWVK